MEVGQDRELYPNLPLIGVVLHSVPHQRQKKSQTESNKKWFGKGLVRENQKRKVCPFFF